MYDRRVDEVPGIGEPDDGRFTRKWGEKSPSIEDLSDVTHYYDYAGVLRRAAALTIDYLVLLFGLGAVVDALGSNSKSTAAVLVGILGYFALLDGHLGGTLGKRLLGIYVVRDTGNSRVGVWRATVRTLFLSGDMLFCGLLGVLAIRRSPFNQRYGDRAAGTVVLRRS